MSTLSAGSLNVLKVGNANVLIVSAPAAARSYGGC